MRSSKKKSNNFFQFKSFRIDQEGVGMKVTTEACVLGGWVPGKLSPGSILDIGSGTGLLALMMAHKFPEVPIEAVELEDQAFHKTLENFHNSPWKDRLSCYHTSIQEFNTTKRYDLIIVNPPFYNRSLSSEVNRVNMARHDGQLSQEELLQQISRLLSDSGQCYVLYPEMEMKRFKAQLDPFGLVANKELKVYNQPKDVGKKVFRNILKLSYHDSNLEEEQLVIRDSEGVYTEIFQSILKEYYLHL